MRTTCISRVLSSALLLLLSSIHGAQAKKAPDFQKHTLELPGMPASVLPADLNGDGRKDLVLFVAYTAWGQETVMESSEFHGVEGLVEVMTVVPAFLNRREVRVYVARGEGGYDEPLILDLETSVLAWDADHPGHPVLALTEDGMATLRLGGAPERPTLELEQILQEASALTGSGLFLVDLQLLHDLDGDALPELLLPGEEAWTLYPGTASGFDTQGSKVLSLEPLSWVSQKGDTFWKALAPRPMDVDGDELPDLVIDEDGRFQVHRNLGDLTFAPAKTIRLSGKRYDEVLVFLGDLDGDGRSEVVSQEELELDDDAGWREEVAEAKRPQFRYFLYSLDDNLVVADEPFAAFRAEGYTFEGDDEGNIRLPAGFQDLDGDGLLDLVSINLDFSMFQVIGLLTAKRMTIGMDFQIWCQGLESTFHQMPDQKLSGKFKLDIENIQLKYLSQFSGDFDANGTTDFLQLGRGRTVTIHPGQPGCHYPRRGQSKLKLERELEHVGLVRVLDLDGDGRSDIYAVHPKGNMEEISGSVPVTLEVFLSRIER